MRFLALLAAAAALWAGPALAAGYGDFTGRWRNNNPGTSDITRLRISFDGGNLDVRAWGQCHPRDCDWGTVDAVAYSPSSSLNPATSATEIIAVYNFGSIRKTLILTARPGNRLSYALYTRFSDGRRPYVRRGLMRRFGGFWPDWPMGGGWPPGGPGGPGGPGDEEDDEGPGPGGPGGPPGSVGLTLHEHSNYDGESRLFTSDRANLHPIGWGDVASSLRVTGPGAWEVCEHVNYAGRCRVVSGNVANLVPGGWNDMISSARRYTGGPGGGGGGETYSTGTLSIPQTYMFDLDQGSVSSGSQADMWFRAVNPFEMYLVPHNGARMWVGNGSNRGYDGCSSGGGYTTARAAIGDVPVGTYVCVRTNGGRYSQFRVNALSSGYPKTLTIGYTTWEAE